MTPGRQRKLHAPSPPLAAHGLLVIPIGGKKIENKLLQGFRVNFGLCLTNTA